MPSSIVLSERLSLEISVSPGCSSNRCEMSPSVTASAVRSTSLSGFKAELMVSQILSPERISKRAPKPPPISPYCAIRALLAPVGSATTKDPGMVVSGTATMRQPLIPASSAPSPRLFPPKGIPWVASPLGAVKLELFATPLVVPPADDARPISSEPSVSR